MSEAKLVFRDKVFANRFFITLTSQLQLINDLYLPFSVNETLDLIRYNRSETLPNEDNFWTPLHYASKYDHWRVYELLIKHIENKNPQDLNGRTPLHIAAQSGNIDVSRSMVA